MLRLEQATTYVDADALLAQRDAAIATASLLVLVANEQRVANLIRYFDVLRSATELTSEGKVKLAVLESRIDAALSTGNLVEGRAE
jgi:hypothetical protein